MCIFSVMRVIFYIFQNTRLRTRFHGIQIKQNKAKINAQLRYCVKRKKEEKSIGIYIFIYLY